MLARIYDAFRRMNRLLTLLGAFFSLFLLVGCAGGNYGRLDRDRDLDSMFLNYEVLPDHRYYTSGGYDSPNAILAIHRDYEWTIRETSGYQFRMLIMPRCENGLIP